MELGIGGGTQTLPIRRDRLLPVTPVRAPGKLPDALGGVADGRAVANCTGRLETEVGADSLFQAGHLGAS